MFIALILTSAEPFKISHVAQCFRKVEPPFCMDIHFSFELMSTSSSRIPADSVSRHNNNEIVTLTILNVQSFWQKSQSYLLIDINLALLMSMNTYYFDQINKYLSSVLGVFNKKTLMLLLIFLLKQV